MNMNIFMWIAVFLLSPIWVPMFILIFSWYIAKALADVLDEGIGRAVKP